MGLSGSDMYHRDALGTAWDESAGNTAMSCSMGLKGSFGSKLEQSLANLSIFFKSDAKGP